MRSSGQEIGTNDIKGTLRKTRRKSFVLACGMLLGLVACDSEETKTCRDEYLKTHAALNSMDSKSLESVEPTLEAVEKNIALCTKAKAQKELAELEKVQKTLKTSVENLRKNASRKELTPEELEKLIKDGDPNCPKGQSYNYRKTNKQVRCTGPQVVSFTRGQAEEYFKNRGFQLKLEGAHLDASFGPESYHYEFTGADSSAKTQCLKVFATPGMSWEESVGRVTGAHPMHLKKGKDVRAADGSTWPLTNTDDEKQAVYSLGKCSN